jgi:hypothetical protein
MPVADAQGKYADFEEPRERAVLYRRIEGSWYGIVLGANPAV